MLNFNHILLKDKIINNLIPKSNAINAFPNLWPLKKFIAASIFGAVLIPYLFINRSHWWPGWAFAWALKLMRPCLATLKYETLFPLAKSLILTGGNSSYFILENKCQRSTCIRLPAHNNKIKRRPGANFLYGANRRGAKLIYFDVPNEKRLLFPSKMREKLRKSRKKCKNSRKMREKSAKR